jgi:hypothetical protein
MPFWKFERRRTGSPARSISPSRSSTAPNIARICTRAKRCPFEGILSLGKADRARSCAMGSGDVWDGLLALLPGPVVGGA